MYIENYLPFKVKVVASTKPPIQEVYNYAKNNPDDEVLWVVGARDGNEEDFQDIASRTKSITKYPNIELRTIVTKGGVSGTAARNAAKVSPEKLNQFLPDFLSTQEKQSIFVVLNNEISEILSEAKQVGNLYHYTSADGLKGILQSNSINASEEEYLGNDLYFVSFTRNKNFHKKGQNFNVKTDYRITLDGDKLSNRYKIKPFAYIPGWNYTDNWEYDWLEDEPESVARDFFNATGDYDEQEERISFKDANGSIPNIKDYILKVDKVSDLKEYFTTKPLKVPTNLNEHASYTDSINIPERIAEFTNHMLDKGMNIEPLPTLEFIDGDSENAKDFLGKTAYYDPDRKHIVLYTEGRHPKDIVRSYAHEMIHHIQNLEGRLGNVTTTNTTEDDNLTKLEAEANLKGTMTFRGWTDSIKEGKKKDPFGLNAYAAELGRLREEEQDWKIYLDMDGVVADFDKRFRDLAGMGPKEFENKYGKNKFWDFIDEGDNKIKFWVGIPPMDGASQLVDYVSQHDYSMLTAPSAKKQSRLGKLLWIRNHTGDIFPSKPQVIFKKAKEKHLVKPSLTEKDILIDDRADTISNWESAGGTGILYTSASQVISALKKLGL